MIGIITEIIIYWLILGILAWVEGTVIDIILFKENKKIEVYWIICGPLLWLIVFNALIHGIIYAIKKKKHLRKYN